MIDDAGLPVPQGLRCIDLAVTFGVPRFLEVLDAITAEMVVENAFRAAEAGEIGQQIDVRVTTEQISHDAFKTRCNGARAIIRTGEATPYANVGLVAGVAF